jgi:hypothetical protein
MDVIKVLGNSVAGRDGVSCQEIQLLRGMDIIEDDGRLIFWEGCALLSC